MNEPGVVETGLLKRDARVVGFFLFSRTEPSPGGTAPSPDTPPPARLLDVPTDLLVRVVTRCDSPLIAHVAAFTRSL